MTSRLLSAGNFMLDAFAISFLFVFLNNETDIPLAFVWLTACFLIAVASFFIFWKMPYHIGWATVIAAFFMSLSLLQGAPLWLLALMLLLAVYRLHARFTVFDDGLNHDGPFLLVFVLLFSASLVFSLFNPDGSTLGVLYAIAIAALIFYTLFRLLYRFLQARPEGASFVHAAALAGGVLGAAAITGLLVRQFADEARSLVGTVLSGIVQLVMWPFAGLLEKMTNYLSGLSTEQEMLETLDKMEPAETAEEVQTVVQPAAADFPTEIMLGVLLVLALALLVFWIRKIKPEKESRKEASPIELERSDISVKTPEVSKTKVSYSLVDLDVIREAFRDFEKAAAATGLGRKEFETVREWAARLQWPVTESFYKTYDLVRYGNGQVSESEAQPFLDEINSLEKKYFHEEV